MGLRESPSDCFIRVRLGGEGGEDKGEDEMEDDVGDGGKDGKYEDNSASSDDSALGRVVEEDDKEAEVDLASELFKLKLN